MAQFLPEPIWVQCRDPCGRVYWRNRINSEERWDSPMLVGPGYGIGVPPWGVGVGHHPHVGFPYGMHPPVGQLVVPHLPVAHAAGMEQPLGLGVGMHPNIMQPINFIPSVKAIAEAWEKLFDKKEKKDYWHNTITGETTWKDPTKEVNPPPPPPPPPSPP